LYWIEQYNSIEDGYNIVNHRVYQFDLDGNLLNSYLGYTEAANKIGKPQGIANIYKCCKGTISTSYGYKWSLSPNLEAIDVKKTREPHSTKKREVLQLDLSGNVIKSFSSCTEAARSVGSTTGAICHACSGRAKSCKGYRWKYSEED
jgi:hypothetical protein